MQSAEGQPSDMDGCETSMSGNSMLHSSQMKDGNYKRQGAGHTERGQRRPKSTDGQEKIHSSKQLEHPNGMVHGDHKPWLNI